MRVRSVLTGLGLLSLVGVVPEAHAQYFGRNAVQWERVRFEVLKTAHFDVYHYPEGRSGAEVVGKLAERWHARLGRVLDYDLKERQPIVLYASHPQFQQTHTIGGAPGEGTGRRGTAEHARGCGVVRHHGWAPAFAASTIPDRFAFQFIGLTEPQP